MIIVKVPLRISLFGGGTDFKSYFNQHKGAVISTAIDKHFYIGICGNIQEYGCEIPTQCFTFKKFDDISDVRHRIVPYAFQMMHVENCKVSLDYELPAQSGLGTSSAISVGLLYGLQVLNGTIPDKKLLARQAITLERDLLKEKGGWQDQIAIAYGGFNRIDFWGNDFSVNPIEISVEKANKLNKNLMLFYTGISRSSSKIQNETQKQISEKVEVLDKLYELTNEANHILSEQRDLDQIGFLLDDAWNLKKQLSDQVSTENVDYMYTRAKKIRRIRRKNSWRWRRWFFAFIRAGRKAGGSQKEFN